MNGKSTRQSPECGFFKGRLGGRGANESYLSADVDETGAENERPLIELSPGLASVEVRGRSSSAPATPPLRHDAGGTLAAALAYRLKSSPQQVLGQVLIYPSLGGDQLELDSYRDNAEAPLLSTTDISFYRGSRCADDVLPLDDPEFYPLAAGDFRGIAPTIAFSADIDPLRDDARVYVERLQDAGVAARWINEPGLVHDYLRARHVSRVASAAFTRICDAISELTT